MGPRRPSRLESIVLHLPVPKAALHPTGEAFFADTVAELIDAQLPFLLGGAYAVREYTGIVRQTKDLDLFVRPEDGQEVLDTLSKAGCRSELTDPTWLGKAYCGEHFVDIIWSSANRIARVDELWFRHAPRTSLFGREVRIVPVEEMIWSKAFVMERERYDGADIAHLLLHHGHALDWARLYRRMRRHWEVLFAHLLLFQFSYPSAREVVPRWLQTELEARARRRQRPRPRTTKECRGTLLSRKEYEIDVNDWGFERVRD